MPALTNVLLTLFCLVGALSARAGNRHEHFHALLSDTAIERAYQDWARTQGLTSPPPDKIGDIPLPQMMADPASAIAQVYGPEALAPVVAKLGFPPTFSIKNPADRKAFQQKTAGLTLGQFSDLVAEANKTAFSAKREAWIADVQKIEPAVGLPSPPVRRRSTLGEMVMTGWLSMNPLTRTDPDAYQAMEIVRRTFLEDMIERHGIQAFEAFWSKALVAHWSQGLTEVRNVIDLSVPKVFFRREIFEASRRAVDSQFKFLLSMPRGTIQQLSDEEFEAELQLAAKAIEEGWGHGIDVTGSIKEATDKALDAEALEKEIAELERQIRERGAEADRRDSREKGSGRELRESIKELRERLNKLRGPYQKARAAADKLTTRLVRLLTVMGEANGEVRLHAFEAANSGPFYTAMRAALEKMQREGRRLPRLRIGHIAAMTPADVDWLARFSERCPLDRRPIVEANPHSNHVLHGTPWKQLADTLVELHKKGVKVVLGSDEEGVLGGLALLPGLVEQLRAAGMPEQVLADITADTLEKPRPKPGTNADDVMFPNSWHCAFIPLTKNHLYMVNPHIYRPAPGQRLAPPPGHP